MTLGQTRGFVVVDTSVLSYFASEAEQSGAYRALLVGRTIALSFFVRTELDGRNWDELRRARLDALYRECVPLPPVRRPRGWYNTAHRLRREMRKSGVPYMSHDRGACEVARALGIEVLTALQDD